MHPSLCVSTCAYSICVCRFAAQLGAFINLESTGPWGPDVVFQHTGDWTLQVSVVHCAVFVHCAVLHTLFTVQLSCSSTLATGRCRCG